MKFKTINYYKDVHGGLWRSENYVFGWTSYYTYITSDNFWMRIPNKLVEVEYQELTEDELFLELI